MPRIATVINSFIHDFGAGTNNLTVNVPAGAVCHWHEENQCWYVDATQVEAFARHDAIYRGIPVSLDNLALDRRS
ncbi:hypothetical protein [Sphingopyxis flava]|uniref:Uncharacterized protein n=1 Tax=Sphingopyxis flava TaxID=1507287 RepID=A0A1T5BRG5_9SPHN|nr:hypothetical protein [Sphingopyxis flava]SKB49982.1 hypothetical protein SAMN06295937_100792 [Sphingopyxis flava]